MSVPIVRIPVSTSSCEPFIKQGDTIGVISIDMGSTFTDDLTSDHIIRIQLYKNGSRVINLSSESSGITITGAKTFEIDEVVENTYPVGVSKGDVQIEKYSGTDVVSVETIFNIEYTVVEQFTKIT